MVEDQGVFVIIWNFQKVKFSHISLLGISQICPKNVAIFFGKLQAHVCGLKKTKHKQRFFTAEQEWRSVVPHVKCNRLLGDWLSGRAEKAPDKSECTCGFWSFAVVEMCESGGPNPPSHYQCDAVQFLTKIVFLQVFALGACTWILSGLQWTWCQCAVGGWCRGWLDQPCCVLRRITDYRLSATLQAHRHCCLTWIFCVKCNTRD